MGDLMYKTKTECVLCVMVSYGYEWYVIVCVQLQVMIPTGCVSEVWGYFAIYDTK